MENLEKEFSARRLAHLFTILSVKMTDYYRTLAQNEINFIWDSPEKRAEDAVQDLYNRDYPRFLRLYEIAYQELAQRGEF